MEQIKGVTFDFYDTLIHTRYGMGRGEMYMDYLMTQGLRAAPWEHDVLYDISLIEIEELVERMNR